MSPPEGRANARFSRIVPAFLHVAAQHLVGSTAHDRARAAIALASSRQGERVAAIRAAKRGARPLHPILGGLRGADTSRRRCFMANLTGMDREAAAKMGERASELAGQAADSVREAARPLADSAKEAASVAGERLRHVASDLREQMPESFADVASAARSGLEQGISRLREADLEKVKDTTVDWVRRNPMEAVLLGVGVGILFGSLVSWRRSRSGPEAYVDAATRGVRSLAQRAARA
jgi:ElaB/YqjD/DUF883 family membrane-anchored ribosome-binding protein